VCGGQVCWQVTCQKNWDQFWTMAVLSFFFNNVRPKVILEPCFPFIHLQNKTRNLSIVMENKPMLKDKDNPNMLLTINSRQMKWNKFSASFPCWLKRCSAPWFGPPDKSGTVPGASQMQIFGGKIWAASFYFEADFPTKNRLSLELYTKTARSYVLNTKPLFI